LAEKAKTPESNILDGKNFCQIGIVVNNIDKTIDFYTRMFGFGPYEIKYVDYSAATYYGKTAGYRGKRAFFRLGPGIEIELIELIDGKTIHEDFLKKHGEGLNHIGFKVDDLKTARDAAEKAGFQITQGFMRPDGSGFAYIDTEKTGGVIFELIEPPPQT